jgi:hypothetical protein
MKRWLILLAPLPILLLVGCHRAPLPQQAGDPPETPTAGDNNGAPPRGARDEESWGLLEFDIEAVYPNQSPTEAAPWHAGGGDWTFFDCRVAARPPVDFLVGVRGKGKAADISWGEATLLVADRAAGERFLDVFGKAFHQESPRAKSPQPLRPWKFGTAILATNMRHAPNGGLQGTGGDWQATKWFPEWEGQTAEVFFNYDLKGRKGEFSEKDPDYRQDLLAILAGALRDGPRPERTPQTDPNLTEAGPHISEPVLVCKNAAQFMFSPGGKKVVYTVGDWDEPSVIYAVAPEAPNDTVELARLEKIAQSVKCLDSDALRLLVIERTPKEPRSWSSDDPERLWWIDRAKNQRQALQGPWGDRMLWLADNAASPDARYVVIRSLKPGPGKGNHSILHVLDRQSDKVQSIEIPDKSLDHVGWSGEGAGLRVVFAYGGQWDNKEKRRYFEADPVTGAYALMDPQPAADDQARPKSPDGTMVAELERKKKLVVTELKSGKRQEFAFHEDDLRYVREGCFEWVSPHYLRLHWLRLAFLDVRTMKMNYATAKSEEGSGYIFSPDFRWALWQRPDQGLFLGRVTGAEGDR